MAAEGFGEIVGAGKAGGSGDIADWQVGGVQEARGAIEAPVLHV